MGIGVGIFLLAVGAILAFAVTDSIADVDLTAVGYILMAAGVLGILLSLLLSNQRRRTSHTVIEDRHIHNDPI